MVHMYCKSNLRSPANLSFKSACQNCAFRGRPYESANWKRKNASAHTLYSKQLPGQIQAGLGCGPWVCGDGFCPLSPYRPAAHLAVYRPDVDSRPSLLQDPWPEFQRTSLGGGLGGEAGGPHRECNIEGGSFHWENVYRKIIGIYRNFDGKLLNSLLFLLLFIQNLKYLLDWNCL